MGTGRTLGKAAVFTSTRSEYGLLLPLLRKLAADPRFDLRLLAGGSHLLPSYGLTMERIREDGFQARREFPFLAEDSAPDAAARSMGLLARQMGAYLAEEPPDILIILGDRFELLPVASTALVMNIPVAHISGGDVTEGAIDNQARHALSKMAHLHFPALEAHKRNLLRMGEEEWRICVAGEPGLDGILSLDAIPRETLFNDLGLPAQGETVIATFHPETLSNAVTPGFLGRTVEGILAATPYHLLFTASNFDPGGEDINRTLRSLAAGNPRIRFVESLGQKRYYSMLRHARLMIGNSSSALTEAQSFGLPAVDVGARQQGRIANPNVVHAPADPDGVLAAMARADSEAFRASFRGRPNLYGDGRAAGRMIDFLLAADPGKLLLKRNVFP